MRLELNTYSFILLGGALIACGLVYIAWRRRPAVGSGVFAILMCSVATWSAAYGLELGASELPAKILWSQVQYIGIVTIPGAWFYFVLLYAHYDAWFVGRRPWLLCLEPVIVLLLVWSNGWLHNWFWAEITLDTSGTLPMFHAFYGPAFMLHTAYSYTLLLGSAILLILLAWRSQRLYRRQAVAILAASLAPWVGNGIYLADISPFDLTPFGFIVTGIVVVYSLYRFQFLDLVPMAREKMLESISDGVLAIDLQGRVVDLNPAAEAIIGRRSADLVGQTIESLLINRPDLSERFQRAQEGRTEIVLGTDSNERIYDVTLGAVRDRHGQLNGRVLVLRDITQMRRAERELHRQALVFENILDSVIITDIQGKIVDVNAATELMFGYSKAESLGKSPGELWHLPGSADILAQSILSGIQHEGRWKGEIQFMHKDGRLGDAEVVVVPLLDEAGQRVASIGVSHDITERNQAEAALRAEKQLSEELVIRLSAAKDEADVANRAKSAFLANTSHELRTPLTSIIGYTELLQSKAGELTSEKELRYLGHIHTSGQHLLGIVNDILDLSRIEAGRLELTAEDFNVRPVIDDVLTVIQPQIDQRRNVLVAEINDDLGRLHADALRFRQILVNLLGNAAKFTVQGTVTVRAWRTTNELGDWVYVQVADTGIGMTPDQVTRLFQPFTQIDQGKDRLYGGTGLGLAISQRLCQMLGGEITVQSEPGKGSIFTVSLPADGCPAG